MRQRGHNGACDWIPWVGALAVAAGIAIVGTTPLAVETGDQLPVAATLLFLGDVRRRDGLTRLVGWLLGGSLLGAGLGYAATVWLAGVPLGTTVGVGLGLALGGGVGAVSNLLAADARGSADAAETGESMTVDMETDDSPSPQPADLFDDHPDPVLYVADQGHGPVVLAANDAFARTFDVPADAISGTPLEETLLAADDENGSTGTESSGTAAVVDAVDASERIDIELACRTPDGTARFRVRTIGRDTDGYVIYTPTGEE